MAAEGPRVAVVIPAKDCAGSIVRAVRSALDQPEAVEVAVIDDGSSDSTAAAARQADDGSGRLTVLSQPNRGPSAAVNRGQAATRAPYFCVLDADDFFLGGRLAAIFAGAGEDWDLAADKLLLVNDGAEDGPRRPWAGRTPASGRLGFAEFVVGNISDPRRPWTELGFLQPVFRRRFFETADLRHNEAVRLGEDYLLYAEALARGARFRVVENRGYVAVIRPGSLSRRHGAEDLAALLAADRALLAVPGLTRADRRALRQHIRHVHDKLMYRRGLDAKAQGHLLTAVGHVARTPSAFGYALARSLEARVARLNAGAAQPASNEAPAAV